MDKYEMSTETNLILAVAVTEELLPLKGRRRKRNTAGEDRSVGAQSPKDKRVISQVFGICIIHFEHLQHGQFALLELLSSSTTPRLRVPMTDKLSGANMLSRWTSRMQSRLV